MEKWVVKIHSLGSQRKSWMDRLFWPAKIGWDLVIKPGAHKILWYLIALVKMKYCLNSLYRKLEDTGICLCSFTLKFVCSIAICEVSLKVFAKFEITLKLAFQDISGKLLILDYCFSHNLKSDEYRYIHPDIYWKRVHTWQELCLGHCQGLLYD